MTTRHNKLSVNSTEIPTSHGCRVCRQTQHKQSSWLSGTTQQLSLQPISSWTLDRHKIIPSPVYVALLKGAIVAAVSVSALRNGRTHQQHILIYSSVQYRIRH